MAEKTLYWNDKGFGENPGGGTSGVAWGAITGTLSSQTDLNTEFGKKQDTLVSGTNIKTINSTSLLGSGNIAIGDGWTEIRKSADQVINSTTGANISNFSFSIENGKTYEFICELKLKKTTGTGTGTNNLQLFCTPDGVNTLISCNQFKPAASNRWSLSPNTVFTNFIIEETGYATIGAMTSTYIDIIFTAGTTGTFRLQSMLTTNPTSHVYTTIQKNSILRYRELT